MADNTVLDPGAGGDTIRDVDHAGVKTQIVGLDLNPAGAESLMAGTMPVNDARPSSGAPTQVASSATSVTLQASNTARKGLTIFNDSTQVLYVKFGTTASSTSYNVQIAAGGYYEAAAPCYTGRVDGIWASANGNAYVAELT